MHDQLPTSYCSTLSQTYSYKRPVWQFWHSPIPECKGISLFYNQLHAILSFAKSNPLNKRCSDLQSPITDQQQQKAINIDLTVPQMVLHPTFQLNTNTIVPTYVGEDVAQFYMLWYCPHIRSYLNSVYHLITKITGIITGANFKQAILSTHVDKFS